MARVGVRVGPFWYSGRAPTGCLSGCLPRALLGLLATAALLGVGILADHPHIALILLTVAALPVVGWLMFRFIRAVTVRHPGE